MEIVKTLVVKTEKNECTLDLTKNTYSLWYANDFFAQTKGQFSIYKFNGKDPIQIMHEITDYVNVECDKFTRDELYDVYKNLREQGIIWLDPGEDNLGRMNKKTCESHESKKYLLKQNGFLKNPNYIKNELNVGDVVIIDLDYLIYEEELEYDKEKIRDITRTMEIYRFTTRENLEKRYQEEKQQVKKLVR